MSALKAYLPQSTGRLVACSLCDDPGERHLSIASTQAELLGGTLLGVDGGCVEARFDNAEAAVIWSRHLAEACDARVGLASGDRPPAVRTMARRLSGAATRGQVIADRAAARRIEARVARTVPRGEYRFDDEEGTFDLWSVDDGPAPRAWPAACSNLPTPASPFVGRRELLDRAVEGLADGRHLITFRALSGLGRRRLAHRVAARVLGEYAGAGGVWTVPCEDVTSLSALAQRVGRTLGVPPRSTGMRAVNEIGAALAGRGRTLLILTGVDALIDSAEHSFGGWLRGAPELRLILTAETRTGLPEELDLGVPPLDTEDALALFMDRSLAAGGKLHAGRDAMITFLQRIDMTPLAVEQAARWMEMIGLYELEQRLARGDRMPLPGVTHRSHQEGMAATWERLTPWERSALVQCAMFEGSFTLDAAESVVTARSVDGTAPTIGMIRTLRDVSLLHETAGPDGDRRFGMFHFVRDFARAQRDASADREGATVRHTRFFLTLARERGAGGASAVGQLQRLRAERANLEAVRERCLEHDPIAAIDATLALDVILAVEGPVQDRLALLDEIPETWGFDDPHLQARLRWSRADAALERGLTTQALEEIQAGLDQLVGRLEPYDEGRLRLLLAEVEQRLGRGVAARVELDDATRLLEITGRSEARTAPARMLARIALDEGMLEQADAAARTAREAATAADETRERALAELLLAEHRLAARRTEEVLDLLESANETFHAIGDVAGSLWARVLEARAWLDQGAVDRALPMLQEAESELLRDGHERDAAETRGWRGRALQEQGDLDAARSAFQRAIGVLEELGDLRTATHFAHMLATALHEAGEPQSARSTYEGVISRYQQMEDPMNEAMALARLGALRADTGDVGGARAVLEASRTRFGGSSLPWARQLDVHAAHLHSAEIRAHRDATGQHARAVLRRLEALDAEEKATPSCDARLARRLLQRTLDGP